MEVSIITNGTSQPPRAIVRYWKWWLMMIFNILFVLAGHIVGNLVGRFYYDQGGNSKWIISFTGSAGFPILLPLIIFLKFHNTTPTTIVTHSSPMKITSIYIVLGVMIAGSNIMYSYGLRFLTVSTYSLICATQLAFNAIFSYFLNSQKLTHLIFNSIVLLTLSATLLGVHSDSNDIPNGNFLLGFILTIGASAFFSLILSLVELSFQRAMKRDTLLAVLEMQICTAFVAACTNVVGLFASGEWRTLGGEMTDFAKGRVSYKMTLVWSAISWQLNSVGTIGLSFVVSSLFASVISTVALPLVPIFAIIFFHDKMDGVKVVSVLLALWGFLSYIYQHYLDDLDVKKVNIDIEKNFEDLYSPS